MTMSMIKGCHRENITAERRSSTQTVRGRQRCWWDGVYYDDSWSDV